MSTSSRIARRPRAPVPRLSALLAIAVRAAFVERDLHLFEAEELGVLLRERVLRLLEDPDERLLVERLERNGDRKTADELGNHSVAKQIVRLDFAEHLRRVDFLLAVGLLNPI